MLQDIDMTMMLVGAKPKLAIFTEEMENKWTIAKVSSGEHTVPL